MPVHVGMELILTCESCGHVEHRDAVDYDDCLKQYAAFRCPKECSTNLLSYIALPKKATLKSAFFS